MSTDDQTDPSEQTQKGYGIDFPDKTETSWKIRGFLWDGVYLVIMMMVLGVINSRIGRVGVMVMIVIAILGFVSGRSDRHYMWIFRQVQNLWIAKAWKNHVWMPQASGNGSKKSFLASLIRPPSILFRYRVRHVDIEGMGRIAILENVRSKTFSIFVTGSGSSMSSQSLREQYEFHAKLAEVFKRAASVAAFRNHRLNISQVFRRRPYDTTNMFMTYSQNLKRGVLYPETIDVPPELEGIPIEEWVGLTPERVGIPYEEWSDELSRAVRQAGLNQIMVQELPDVMMEHAGDPSMVIVCTLSAEKSLKSASSKKGKGIKRKKVSSLPILQVAKVLVDGLSGLNVTNPRVYNVEDLHRYLRTAWDVVGAESYYEQVAEGDAASSDNLHWPRREVMAFRDHSQTDGTHHSVIRITGVPKLLAPNYLRQVFGVDVSYLSVALVTETSGSRGEVRRLDWAKAMSGHMKEQMGIVYESHASQQRARARSDRQERIAQAGFRAEFAIFIAVSAGDGDSREEDVQEVISRLRAIGIDASLVKGECYQVPALFTASTGVDNL